MDNSFKSHRRFLLLAAYDATTRFDFGIASALRGKQQAEPGTPLGPKWPGYEKLLAAYYTTREDLDGANVAELMKIAGLTRSTAQAAIDALQETTDMTAGTGYYMADGRYADTEQVVPMPSIALTTQTIGTPVELGARPSLRLAIAVSVVAGTNPTLDVTMQTAKAKTGPWRTLGSFHQLTAVGGPASLGGPATYAMGAVTATGTTPPAITLTSTAANRYVKLRVECTTLGARGTALVRYSTDGGVTWVSGVTTAATLTVYDSSDGLATVAAGVASGTDTGIVINYASATAAVDNVWTAETSGHEEKIFGPCDRFVRYVAQVGGTSNPSFTTVVAGEASAS